ncbi:hypothetical protein NH341_10310 [Tenacibaculum sp. XPcli2-G]|uniref:hypothetical protein n=1 Tax=Tenacibaculum sp. XPcli2-G TaxID=2954503 RepID=UPI002096BC27|nr:hypothetical protein [Tenacibaculum sp. XPcli2-G]MCO7185822.1 hypothetical protein [Tenacibaculum sp. XPcli2-G]
MISATRAVVSTEHAVVSATRAVVLTEYAVISATHAVILASFPYSYVNTIRCVENFITEL